jgi:hypothetical protein
VVQQSSRWLSALEGHIERVEHQVPILSLIAQPTIIREKRSMTTARYNQPCLVQT